jgi:hypothetical protein
MPINSLDHLMRKTTDGSIQSTDWQFTTNRLCVASRWNCAGALNSPPGAVNTYPATNGALTWVDCNASSEFALPIGPSVDELNNISKHIIFGSALTATATGVPSVLMLVDLQGYWPSISPDTTDEQLLSGTPTLRYANGEGLKLYPVVTTATDANSPNLALSYTNQAGVTGSNLSQTLTVVASAAVGTLYHAQNVTTSIIGPFLPLANGDTGVQTVNSVTMSGTLATGEFALCLAKPLLTIPLVTISNIMERDFANQLPSLPRVRNDACLVWLYYSGAATVINTNFYGSLELVWG